MLPLHQPDIDLAEAVRFELTEHFCSSVFKTGAISQTLPHFHLIGGCGRNRTYGVSHVTDLQSAAFAARHTHPLSYYNTPTRQLSMCVGKHYPAMLVAPCQGVKDSVYLRYLLY